MVSPYSEVNLDLSRSSDVNAASDYGDYGDGTDYEDEGDTGDDEDTVPR